MPRSCRNTGQDCRGARSRQYLDSTKLRELTGWAPAVDLRPGLERTVEWYREHEEVRP